MFHVNFFKYIRNLYKAAPEQSIITVFFYIMGVLTVGVGVATCLYLIRKWRESSWGWCHCQNSMEGKVVLITGANSGIGFETAKILASKGAVIVMACRSPTKTLKAIQNIRKFTSNGDLVYMDIELSNYISVKSFVENFLEKFDRLDVLINNAGIYHPPVTPPITNDKGVEIHFAVNHLGHFLLTHLLTDVITATPQSRVLFVSSELYKTGFLHLEDLTLSDMSEMPKGRNPLYSNSKLANLLHARELNRRLHGKGVAVATISPGFVYSDLFRNSIGRFGFLKKIAFAPLAFFFMRSTIQGAQTSIYCACSPDIRPMLTPTYYQNCKPLELLDKATDDHSSKELWNASMKMLKLKDTE